MSEMLERVARAVEPEIGKLEAVSAAPHVLRELQAKRVARAAIEAMREPTAGMVNAGLETYCEHGDQNCGCAISWSAMIDAALCGDQKSRT
jgi:hypothetical protein